VIQTLVLSFLFGSVSLTRSPVPLDSPPPPPTSPVTPISRLGTFPWLGLSRFAGSNCPPFDFCRQQVAHNGNSFPAYLPARFSANCDFCPNSPQFVRLSTPHNRVLRHLLIPLDEFLGCREFFSFHPFLFYTCGRP